MKMYRITQSLGDHVIQVIYQDDSEDQMAWLDHWVQQAKDSIHPNWVTVVEEFELVSSNTYSPVGEKSD